MINLDPRCKLYLLLISNFLLFFHVDLITECIIMTLLVILMFLSRKKGSAIKLCITYIALVLWNQFVVVEFDNIFITWISMLAVTIRMMYPCIASGIYAFTTTTVSEFVCALRKMHVPKSIIIPCMVVIRFFPTIKEDYTQIRNAMILRDNGSLIRHPSKSLEYVLIPLLMNSNSVAEDLTYAALTKGLSNKGTHTCYYEIHFGKMELFVMFLFTLPLALNIGGIL